MPGSGWPESSATTRSRMSRRSVARSAISPPIFWKVSTNCSVAPTVATSALVPPFTSFATARAQPRSRARDAVAPRTSAATPVAALARAASRSATAPAAALKRATSSSRRSSGTGAPPLGNVGRAVAQITGA